MLPDYKTPDWLHSNSLIKTHKECLNSHYIVLSCLSNSTFSKMHSFRKNNNLHFIIFTTLLQAKTGGQKHSDNVFLSYCQGKVRMIWNRQRRCIENLTVAPSNTRGLCGSGQWPGTQFYVGATTVTYTQLWNLFQMLVPLQKESLQQIAYPQ